MVSTIALLSACAVKPAPYTQAEFETRAAADRKAIFKDQQALSAPLTLEQALERVLKYNLDRRAKMMEEALALGQTDLDRFDLLPKITANAGYSGRSEPNATVSRDLYTQTNTSANPTYSDSRDSVTADLGLTWNILDFGVSYVNAHQNADRALIASERRRRTVQNLAQEVRFTFWRAAAAQELREKVKGTVAAGELALKDAEKAEAERLRNPADSLRIQKTLLETVRQLEAIDQELVNAKAELSALINLPPGSSFTLDTSRPLQVPVIDLPIDRMEELALANNPDLREQDYMSRISIDETRKEILKLLPGINFSVSHHYDNNAFLIDNRWNEAGAKISWNLMNVFSASSRIDHAETAEKVAETKRLALRMAVLAQVHVVSNQFASAAKQFTRADKLWNIETRLAETTANRSQGGTQSQIEMITQETSAIAAELRRYQTYAQLQQAFGKLQATLGNEPFIKPSSVASVETLSEGIPGAIAVAVPTKDAAAPAQESAAEPVTPAVPAAVPVAASEPQPALAPAPKMTAASGNQGLLYLSSAATPEEAEGKWKRLSDKVPALRQWQPDMVSVDNAAEGTYVSLRITGDTNALASVCADLKSQKQFCKMRGETTQVASAH